MRISANSIQDNVTMVNFKHNRITSRFKPPTMYRSLKTIKKDIQCRKWHFIVNLMICHTVRANCTSLAILTSYSLKLPVYAVNIIKITYELWGLVVKMTSLWDCCFFQYRLTGKSQNAVHENRIPKVCDEEKAQKYWDGHLTKTFEVEILKGTNGLAKCICTTISLRLSDACHGLPLLKEQMQFFDKN